MIDNHIDGVYLDRVIASFLSSTRLLTMAILNLITDTITYPRTLRGQLVLTLVKCKSGGGI